MRSSVNELVEASERFSITLRVATKIYSLYFNSCAMRLKISRTRTKLSLSFSMRKRSPMLLTCSGMRVILLPPT